jgi:hypothetical protein
MKDLILNKLSLIIKIFPLIFLISCFLTHKLIGTIENNGTLYRAYNDIFILETDDNISNKNINDDFDEIGYHFIEDEGWGFTKRITIYRNPQSIQMYKETLMQEFKNRNWEYINVYTNIIETDSIDFHFDAYKVNGSDPFYGNNYSNMYIITMLCYSDLLQMRISFFNHTYIETKKNPAPEMSVGIEKNMLKYFSKIKIDKKIYGFNLPEPINN